MFKLIEISAHYWNRRNWNVIQFSNNFNFFRVKHKTLQYTTCWLFAPTSLKNVILPRLIVTNIKTTFSKPVTGTPPAKCLYFFPICTQKWCKSNDSVDRIKRKYSFKFFLRFWLNCCYTTTTGKFEFKSHAFDSLVLRFALETKQL